MSRRSLALVAVPALVAAGLGTGLWLAFGTGGRHEPTEAEYLARVSSVCQRYARQLARISAPSDIAAYGDVVDAVSRVLPLLRKQAAAMQAIEPPAVLRPRLDRLFALSRRSTAEIEGTLAAARQRDAGGVAKGLGRFSVTRDRSHALAVALGIDCETN